MKVICTVCARGGSKGVLNKNIRVIGGKPLLAYTLELAQTFPEFIGVGVSSDSDDILNVAKRHQASWIIKRPDELATDQAGKIGAIRHAVAEIEKKLGHKVDVVCDLDATSPLRIRADLEGALRQFHDQDADNLITAMHSRRSPYFNLIEKHSDGSVKPSKTLEKAIVRRQDAPACYDMNASIYIWKRDILFKEDTVFLPKTSLYVMPEERSWDIDSEFDFKIVSWLLENR